MATEQRAAVFVAWAGLGPVLATALAMVVVFAGRFLLVDRWLYRSRAQPLAHAAPAPTA
ncbi:hypothetical protein [Streptomyces hypolithicus]